LLQQSYNLIMGICHDSDALIQVDSRYYPAKKDHSSHIVRVTKILNGSCHIVDYFFLNQVLHCAVYNEQSQIVAGCIFTKNEELLRRNQEMSKICCSILSQMQKKVSFSEYIGRYEGQVKSAINFASYGLQYHSVDAKIEDESVRIDTTHCSISIKTEGDTIRLLDHKSGAKFIA
jgi:hypothetical protein